MTTDLLTLHTLRLGGVLDAEAIAARLRADPAQIAELLLDHEAFGWVTRVEFSGLSGWALTERGRRANERRLAEELDAAGTRPQVEQAHNAFEKRNGLVVAACTRWQLRSTAHGRSVPNDHDDPDWDQQVLTELTGAAQDLIRINETLTAALPRFGGYAERFATALTHARSGQHEWVAGIEVDSCHQVWMELHADLLSTLGVSRDLEA